MAQYGIGFANYHGPASFSTYLLTRAKEHGLRMATLVAEIPPYIEGTNPRCIEAVIRKLTLILGLQIDLDELRASADAWEQRVNDALNEKPEVAKLIGKMETDYDSEVFDTQMGDLKAWLQQRGIRVD
jgi:proteasome assembly chaperone (PAC2) family protein